MARYKLILAYDGTAFAGSQRQAKHRTVQGELEKALRKLGWSARSVTLAGRTDTGVHASGQVAAFDLEWNHGLEHLRDALNANLPFDIAVKNVEVADAKFHPRFDAIITVLSLSPVLPAISATRYARKWHGVYGPPSTAMRSSKRLESFWDNMIFRHLARPHANKAPRRGQSCCQSGEGLP